MTESVESQPSWSGIFSQDSQRCSSAVKSQIYWADYEKHQKPSQEEFYLCRCFNDIFCDKKDNKEECLANAKDVSIFVKKFGIGQWSFIGPGSEKKWYSMEENGTQGIWDHFAEKMLVEFDESGCPIFRATTPLSRGKLKSKGHGKLSIHFAADQETFETFAWLFLHVSSVFTEQWQLYAKNLNPVKIDQGNLMYWWDNQLFSVKSRQKFFRRMMTQHIKTFYCRDEERIEMLSQENKLSKLCIDAGFISVEIGQYFMTKDNGEQFYAKAWHTLPRSDGSSQPKGWIQGSTKIGPVLEVRPVACMVNTELKLESGLWVKTTLNPGSEFLMDHINLWSIQTTTTQKFLKICLKNKRYNWRWRILHADQRQKQNRKEENLLIIHRASFRWMKGSGLILNQEISLSLRTRFRRK